MKATTRIRYSLLSSFLTAFLGAGPGANAVLAQSADDIKVSVGKSIVIDYPEDISRISTSSPEIVDAVPATTREILLHGKGLGSATVIVWSKAGQRNFYNVSVEPNLEQIRRLIKETFPDEDIHIQAAKESLSLTGRVTTQGVADRATVLATPYGKSIVNNLRVDPLGIEKQIILRVKFVEVNRTHLQSIGINLFSTGALNTIGSTTTQQFPGPGLDKLAGRIPGSSNGFTTEFRLTDLLNVFLFRPDLNLGAMIKALQQESVLQILAEPNLVTTNGKEASFHVGGEFPIPVLQGGANAGAVTVQFREFGIRLHFLPVLTVNRTIKMHVKPEVSTIDLSNAVSISGFTIPALSSRKMETDIELGEGQSFVIGGLLDDRVTETMAKVPGLGNIPILGALFKSKTENKTKTELIVMVTPEVTMPLLPGDPRPTPVFPKEFLPNLTSNTPGASTKAVSPKKK